MTLSVRSEMHQLSNFRPFNKWNAGTRGGCGFPAFLLASSHPNSVCMIDRPVLGERSKESSNAFSINILIFQDQLAMIPSLSCIMRNDQKEWEREREREGMGC